MNFSSEEVTILVPMKMIILTWTTNGVYEDGVRMVARFVRYTNLPQSLILLRDYFLRGDGELSSRFGCVQGISLGMTICS